MDFSLTPEHEVARQMVWESAEREAAPTIKEYNRAHRVNLDTFPIWPKPSAVVRVAGV